MKIAFAGTPGFAATILRGLLGSMHEVGVVISQPDNRRGRGRKISQPPVAELANEEEIELLQPAFIGDIADQIKRYDALVVAAYGQILRADTLYATERGAWNVHASLLPAYRGAAPIERAIMSGEQETGVSIMRMNEGLDTGPVALQEKISISPDINAGDLTSNLSELGAKAMVEVLSEVESGVYTLTEQDDGRATYAAKLNAEDRLVRWDQPARKVHNQVRALAPGIGARTFNSAFQGPVKILRSRVVVEQGSPSADVPAGSLLAAKDQILIQCEDGVISVEKLQVPGGRPVETGEFLRGNKLEGAFTGTAP
ncbi:methionyl-tRNA formyltransferase [soil metagenome]